MNVTNGVRELRPGVEAGPGRPGKIFHCTVLAIASSLSSSAQTINPPELNMVPLWVCRGSKLVYLLVKTPRCLPTRGNVYEIPRKLSDKFAFT